MNKQTCEAIRANGMACTAPSVEEPTTDGTFYCVFHHPNYAERGKAARAQGGMNRSNAARAEKNLPPTLRELTGVLWGVMSAVRYGDINTAQANAMANVARSLIACYEASEMQAELSELREAVEVVNNLKARRRSA